MCRKSAKIANLETYSTDVKRQFAVQVIRQQPRQGDGAINMQNLHGKGTRIDLNAEATSSSLITHEQMGDLRTTLSLSFNQVGICLRVN